MKKSMKALAAIAAAVMSVTAVMPALVYADKNVSVSQAKEDKAEMETALKKVKARITIPEELSEFEYDTQLSYGKKQFAFTWHTPDGAEQYKYIKAVIVGDVLTYYEDGTKTDSKSDGPALAKLTEEQLVAKAKEYVKQLDPDIYPKMKFELSRLSLNSNFAVVSFERYENGIPVTGNEGTVYLDKNTGALSQMSLGWWEDATFADPSAALTEEQVETAYQSLCTLTPSYMLDYNWNETTQKNVPKFTIVYSPDMTSEIDAFTGKASTIRDDRETAKGSRYYYNYENYEYDEAAADADAGYGGEPEDAIQFTNAELEKIQKDNSLITTDEATEMLKKDKYAGLTDNYSLQRYDVYSEKDWKDKETFYLDLTYKLQKGDDLYQTVNVLLNAETGQILRLHKYGNQKENEMPKLDVAKANAIANEVAKTYAKDIISEYKADPDNTRAVETYNYGGKESCETGRYFGFDRYMNGIQVWQDDIDIRVDSLGNVVEYRFNYTEGVAFPSADILSTSDAFAKLYKQRKFDYYYDGWVTEDGSIHTYLVYKMGSFYLNAKTGALCSYLGGKLYSEEEIQDVKYTDIKGIPQEQAILELQKYGIGITNEKKLDPGALITERELKDLLNDAFGSYASPYRADADAGDDNAVKQDKAETTLKEAAVMFGHLYLSEDVAELKGVFRSPFTDVKSNDPDVGYIAVAKAKGFVSGSADGTLGGDKKLTRAEALQLIYDYLKLISE